MKQIKTINKKSLQGNTRKKRVCAYARVSTKNDSQESSFDLQVITYAKEILSNPDYEFAGVYADHGKSGSSRNNRDQFNFMIEKAMMGEIDLILTKSLSRFARNTLDSLTIIQQLRERNVEIYFEKENISSLDTSIDFLISVLSGMAEAESKQVSENCYWAINKRHQEGRIDITHLFGYDITEDRELIINPHQAKAVKQIFNMYIEGKTITEIQNWLVDNNYETIRGNLNWSRSTIKGMLRQEKYVGDAIIQKRCRLKIGSKKTVKNNGIKTKYNIKNNHEGIITKDVFEKAQRIMLERNKKFNKEKDTIQKTYYYKYVYSPIIKKYLQRRTSKINNICYDVLADYDSKEIEFKPVYVKCLEQAMDEAIKKLCENLPTSYNKLDSVTKEIVNSSEIDEKINSFILEIENLKASIEGISNIETAENIKESLYNEATNELILKEFELVELKDKKLIEFNFNQKLSEYKRKLKIIKEQLYKDIQIDYKDIFQKIIAVDRSDFIFCIHLSNKNLENIDLEKKLKGEIVESGNLFYCQIRINLECKWKIIII